MISHNTVTRIDNYSYYNYQIIGEGATGQVHKGFRNIDQLPVAVKKINLKQLNTPVKRYLLDCQVEAVRNIKNRYICQTYDVMKDKEFYYIPMEICPNGNLRQYIQKKGTLSPKQSLTMLEKIVQGYCAIVKAGYIHRDMKTQNILLRSNLQPVIIDFGYCQRIYTQGRRLPYNVGSPAYMSPQSYNQSVYSQKTDIWSIGIILHQMLTGTIPVMRTTDADQYFRYLSKMRTAEIMPGIQNQQCKRILLSILSVNPQLRPSAVQLKNMINLVLSANLAGENTHSSLSRIQFNTGVNLMQSPPLVTRHSQKVLNFRNNVEDVAQNRKRNTANSINVESLIQSNSNSRKLIHFASPNSHIVNNHAKLTNSPAINFTNKKPTQVVPNFGELRKRIVSNIHNVTTNQIMSTPVVVQKFKENQQLLTPVLRKNETSLRKNQTSFKKAQRNEVILLGSQNNIPLFSTPLKKNLSSGTILFSRRNF